MISFLSDNNLYLNGPRFTDFSSMVKAYPKRSKGGPYEAFLMKVPFYILLERKAALDQRLSLKFSALCDFLKFHFDFTNWSQLLSSVFSVQNIQFVRQNLDRNFSNCLISSTHTKKMSS